MAIDDPAEVLIRYEREEQAEKDSLPRKLLEYGLSGLIVTELVGSMAPVAHILTKVLGVFSTRRERGLLKICEALHAELERIKVPDPKYFESEEFCTLFFLLLEKVHLISDEEKFRRFGVALANSGTGDFEYEEKEDFVRILRDLSMKDLRILNDKRLSGWKPHLEEIHYEVEELSSLSRLVGMGLVFENFRGSRMFMGVTPAPKPTYSRSPFGGRFLEFITDRTSQPAEPESAR
ncbi:MAG TPA: hypothetical protein VKU01_23930 [Bryobacteraceae bacterium]|nr:hypothetical protein [Bryobacteraceae bacterium]